MSGSGTDTGSVPEWLIKLESRREQIKAKLGHESGNGAPCIVCGEKCPGLDLHFWRKVCRNCKCRKEQHDCKDDVITGWAQFEILGAIRSKPAYIKISALTDKPVQLDWIPPNVTTDLASDYMLRIGEQNIPIVGSNAAKRRKQQLEFQVPPHDLDASLCHNLSENEKKQLVQYAEKIRKSCVGQGTVIRIGDQHIPTRASIQRPNAHLGSDHLTCGISPSSENLLNQILSSVPIKNALLGISNGPKQQICIQKEMMEPDFNVSPFLSDKMKYKLKLMKLNSEAIRTAVAYASKIDYILNALVSEKIPFEKSCNIMGPLYEFRQAYKGNARFKDEIDRYLKLTAETHETTLYPDQLQASGPSKMANQFSSKCQAAMTKDKVLHDILNSGALQAILHAPVNGGSLIISREPLVPDFSSSPLLSPASKSFLEKIKVNAQVVQSAVINGPLYDELFTKLDNCHINYSHDSVLQPIQAFRDKFISFDKDDCFPKEVIKFVEMSDLQSFDVSADQVPGAERIIKITQNEDSVLLALLSNPALQDALNYGKKPNQPLQLSSNIPNKKKLLCTSKLSPATFEKIYSLKIDYPVLESAIVSGPVYDQLIHRLSRNGINVVEDPLLDSILKLRNECNNDENIRKELARYIAHPEPYLFDPATIEEISPEEPLVNNQSSKMHASHSDDSGFGSVPPTPIFATYPGFNKLTESPPEYKPCADDILPSSLENFDFLVLNELDTNVGQSSHDVSQSHDLVNCKGCSESIVPGEVVVKAERVGYNGAWHPQCFKCHKCNELLADLVYFFHGGEVYCGRDLAHILKIPRCSACDELIFTKEYTAAEGATFHIKHFCCYHCDAPLAGQQYVPDENTSMPLCLGCYNSYFAKVCHHCHTTIGPTEQGVAWENIHWHGKCFICSGKGCDKSLIGGRFCVKNGMPFCSPQCFKSMQF
ncbi:uncharacterized protein LOC134226579 isoform X2 [Armigeres subalbatus]|uniref:uncharacterized protein LOC134226579 isoform X2 n=1 Tax=Armigeres subalbatus TaxID=124917 RepID=UPI002ED15BAB